MTTNPTILRPSKSNTELTTSLRTNFTTHRLVHQTSDSSPPSFRTWTTQDPSSDTLYIPTLNPSTAGLSEDRSSYDITLKLFFLPNIPPQRRCRHTKEALDLVLKTLRVQSVDLLITAFPGIQFDADDESDSDGDLSDPSPTDSLSASDPSTTSDVESVDAMIRTWRTLEALHGQGKVGKLGLSEFGTQRLSRFLADVKVKPAVDQINVRDCCVVPKPLIVYAKKEGIELLTHNDCTNILPRGTLRELLGSGEGGMGVLAGPEDTEGGGEGLKGDVEPQWVIKYTAVVRDRGVVENKGYFAGAELNER